MFVFLCLFILQSLEESSFGIYVSASSFPERNGYVLTSILGFVEALIVGKDPEFEFEERFRTAQKSNEKRQKQLYQIS